MKYTYVQCVYEGEKRSNQRRAFCKVKMFHRNLNCSSSFVWISSTGPRIMLIYFYNSKADEVSNSENVTKKMFKALKPNFHLRLEYRGQISCCTFVQHPTRLTLFLNSLPRQGIINSHHSTLIDRSGFR